MAATLATGAPARPRKLLASRRTRVGILYSLPVVVYLLVLFVYPIFCTLLLSLKDADGSFTLHWYADALTGVNLSVLFTTLRISAETAVLSLVFGFILAQAITRLKPLLAGLAMLVVVVPHFVSALVRTYGWIIMLGDKGLVNETLADLHAGGPYQLLYNELGVVIGTTSMMLPYTVLLLYGRDARCGPPPAGGRRQHGRQPCDDLPPRSTCRWSPPAWPVPDCSASSSPWATTSPPP